MSKPEKYKDSSVFIASKEQKERAELRAEAQRSFDQRRNLEN